MADQPWYQEFFGEEYFRLFDGALTPERTAGEVEGIVNLLNLPPGGRILDLWTAAERAARDAGASTVDRLDLCTRCNEDLFFSERRTGRPRGTQGVLGLVR